MCNGTKKYDIAAYSNGRYADDAKSDASFISDIENKRQYYGNNYSW